LVFWFVMSLSGIVTEEIFNAFDIVPARNHMSISMKHFGFNRTTILNAIALVIVAELVWLYKSKSQGDTEFAKDLVCGMQVRIADAPASCIHNGVTYYFCMPGCQESFQSDPDKFIKN